MGKAVLFIRVSTEEQYLDSQRNELLRIAAIDGFSENDIITIEKKESGYKLEEDEREGLKDLYNLLDTVPVDTIYVLELSRLSRKPKVLYAIREKLKSNGVQLKCSKPNLSLLTSDRKDYDSQANILFGLFGAFAEQEIIEKKARFARGKKQKAKEGKFTGGNIPFGYRIGENNVIERDYIGDGTGEAEIVETIFTMYENGLSQTQIAKELQSRGVKQNHLNPLNNTPRLITLSLVHTVLTNERLTGKPSEERVIVQGVGDKQRTWKSYTRSYPAIISEERFNRCREIASKNNTRIDKTRNIYYANRLIICPVCGTRFMATGQRVIYRCFDAQNVNKQYNGYTEPRCQNKDSISINVMDSLLWHLAQKLEVEYRQTEAKNDLEDYQNQLEVVLSKYNQTEKDLLEIEEKRQRLLEALIDGLSKDRYLKKKTELADDERKINNMRLVYQEEISHLQALIAGITQRFSSDGLSSLINAITNPLSVYEQVKSIESDKMRYEIIHKHIKEISLERTTASFKYGCYKHSIQKEGKLITIHTYKQKTFKFVYVPNAGKGKGYLIVNEDGSMKELEIPYLERFVDIHKRANRLKQRETRLKEKAEKLAQRQSTYLTVTEVAKTLGIRGHKVFYDINHGYLKAEQRADRLYYVSIEEFQNYKQWLSNRGIYKGKRKAASE